VFMAFVLYGGWNGGGAGHGLAVAFGWLLGRARALAPLALCWAGATLVLAGVLPDLRPLRGGLTCLFAALTLALAAGTFGVSSGPGSGHALWGPSFLRAHGGVVGEALYQVAHRLVQDVGVDILVIFLLLGGVIMLTGASVAGTVAAGSAALGRALGRVRPLLDRGPRAREEASPARGGDWRSELCVAAPRRGQAARALERRAGAPRYRRAGADGGRPARGARALRRARQSDRQRHRSPHHAL